MDIIIVENTETLKERLEKYNLLADPFLSKLFCEMEDEIKEYTSKMSCVNFLDKMINKALARNCYFITTEQNGSQDIVELDSAYYFKLMVNNKILEHLQKTAGKCVISDIRMFATKFATGDALGRISENITFSRTDISIFDTKPYGFNNAQALCSLISGLADHNAKSEICKTLQDHIRGWQHRGNVPDIANYSQIAKIIKTENPEQIQKLGQNISKLNAHLGEFLNADDLSKIQEYYEQIENAIWNSILTRIIAEFGPEYKKNKTLGLYFKKPCEHDYQTFKTDPNALQLSGDYLICAHGNAILCKHNLSKNPVDEYGNPCKICGTKFQVIRELILPEVNFYNIEYNDALNRVLFGKTMIAMKYVIFEPNDNNGATQLVTDDFIRKTVKTIIAIITNKVAENHDNIQRIKGFNFEVIKAMQEIITTLYIYACIVNLCNNTTNFKMSLEGTGSMLDRAIVIMDKILSTYTSKIKNFKTFNLTNSFTAILEELKTQNFGIIMPSKEVTQNISVSFSKNFEQEIAYEINLPYLRYGVLHSDPSEQVLKTEIIVPSIQYLAINYDKDHKHDWSKCVFKKGYEHTLGTKPLAEIASDEYVWDLKCSICDKNWSLLELEQSERSVNYAEQLMKKKAINDYYKNYCPINIHHEFKNDVCIKCGYGSAKFNYDTPDNQVKLQLPPEPKYETVTTHINIMLIQVISCDFAGTDINSKASYENFWANLWCTEGVTFKQLLAGEQGNTKTATLKINLEFSYLATFLSRKTETGLLEKFIKERRMEMPIYEMDYVQARNNFVSCFNELGKLAKEYFRGLITRVKNNCDSEESEKAAALINYKQKLSADAVENDSDMQDANADELEDAKNAFSYEGFDYNGVNDEIP